MDTDAWLADELAELDEAEQFIHDTMSAFVPSGQHLADTDRTRDPHNTGVKLDNKPRQQVTKSLSKSDANVGEGIGKVPVKKQENSNHLQQPSSIDRDNCFQKENKSPLSCPPNSSPPLHSPSLLQTKNNLHSAMSKSPPPVLPKPSRSSQFQTKSGVGAITIQLNKPVSPKTPPTKNLSNSFSLPDSPPLDNLPSPPPSHQQLPPPSQPQNDFFPPPPVDLPPSSKSSPFSGIPKEIEKNSMDELDFLTNNLLLNMDNPKDEHFYGYCEKCGGVVEGENVGCKAVDKVYHITCFTCETCGVQLHGEPFYVVAKKSFCEACYLASLETCCVCSELITDRILRATDQAFHPSCFKCGVCNKVLDGVPFTVDDSKNIYCIEDYHQRFASRCFACKQPILPESGSEEAFCIVAMDRDFHVHCYKCEKCGIPFSSEEGCYPIDEHLYCIKCNAEVLRELSV